MTIVERRSIAMPRPERKPKRRKPYLPYRVRWGWRFAGGIERYAKGLRFATEAEAIACARSKKGHGKIVFVTWRSEETGEIVVINWRAGA